MAIQDGSLLMRTQGEGISFFVCIATTEECPEHHSFLQRVRAGGTRRRSSHQDQHALETERLSPDRRGWSDQHQRQFLRMDELRRIIRVPKESEISKHKELGQRLCDQDRRECERILQYGVEDQIVVLKPAVGAEGTRLHRQDQSREVMVERKEF
jgi:hypothetical protein